MEEKIQFLREALYKAIDKGDENEILKISVELDGEIVNAMMRLYVPNKTMCN